MNKDLNYRLTADPTRMERGFKSAEASAAAFERELAKLDAVQQMIRDSMAEVGQTFLVAGVAIGAGLAVATKAAIDWESAWAGVTKTVDGSPAQMAALEAELRDLAGVLPATHTEIAAVAEAAGQLGVKRQDIIEFTKTMIDLGVSTNLTANDAATALARLANIMGTAGSDVRRLSSTIVDLGNNSATTEQEILDMGLRIAGAGKVVGLSEAQVLAFAAALSSVGVMAEAGGSAISRVFINIESAVRGGGSQLQRFASVAGVTADAFAAAYRDDAATAIDMFISGLGRMQKSGGDVFATMHALGMNEIILRDAVLRLAGASDVLTKSLNIGATAWDENIALTEEANKRYATTQARLQIARNRLNDFAIDMGQALLPIVAKAADVVGFLAESLGGLPGPVKQALAILGLLAAAIALTSGAAMVAVPRIAAYRAAVETLANSGTRSGTAIARIANVLSGPWGLAIGAATVLLGAFIGRQAKSNAEVKEFGQTLDRTTGALTENTRALAAHKLQEEGVFQAAQMLGLSLATVTDAALGNRDALEEVRRVTLLAAQANEQLHAGQGISPEFVRQLDLTEEELQRYTQVTYEAGNAAATINSAIGTVSGSVEESRRKWQEQTEAVHGSKAAMEDLPPEQRRLAAALGVTAQEAKEASSQIDQLDKELRALFDATFSVEAAQDALVEAFHRLADQVKQARQEGDSNATSLEGQSTAALANRDAVRQLVEQNLELIEAHAKAGATEAELAALIRQLRTDLVAQLVAMGFAREEAERYAAVLDGVPPLVGTTFTTPGLTRAETDVSRLHTKLRQIDDEYRAVITAQDNASAAIDRVLAKLERLPASKRIALEFGYADGGPVGFADGGRLQGPGGPRSDNLLIAASPGEFLVNAQATARHLPLLEAINAGAMPSIAVTAATTSPAHVPVAPPLSEAVLGRALAAALHGVRVTLDGRTVGQITALTADHYLRGG